jgi:hypothetical protein
LKEFVCSLSDLVYGAIEGEFVCLGGFCEATKFSDELQRRCADFFVRCRRFEVMQGLYISAHFIYYQLPRSSMVNSDDTSKLASQENLAINTALHIEEGAPTLLRVVGTDTADILANLLAEGDLPLELV